MPYALKVPFNGLQGAIFGENLFYFTSQRGGGNLLVHLHVQK